eukprot:2318737-Amphidinium_carterae.1
MQPYANFTLHRHVTVRKACGPWQCNSHLILCSLTCCYALSHATCHMGKPLPFFSYHRAMPAANTSASSLLPPWCSRASTQSSLHISFTCNTTMLVLEKDLKSHPPRTRR